MTGRPARVQPVGVRPGLVAARPAPYRAVSWAPALTDGLTTNSGRPAQLDRLAGREPRGRHDRHAGLGQLAQVASCRCSRRRRSAGLASRGTARRPGEELVPARRVVPGRADHDQVVRAPVDGRVVPDRHSASSPAAAQAASSGAGVLVPGRQLRGRWPARSVAPAGPGPRSARARHAQRTSASTATATKSDRQVGVGQVEQPHRPGRLAPPDPAPAAGGPRPGTRRRQPPRPRRRPRPVASGQSSSEVATVSQE